MKFINQTQRKIVNARGAIRGLWPGKASLTLVATKSRIDSTKFWNPPGVPDSNCLPRRAETKIIRAPSKTLKKIVSTFNTQKPSQSPVAWSTFSGLQTILLVKWCCIYSTVPIFSANGLLLSQSNVFYLLDRKAYQVASPQK